MKRNLLIVLAASLAGCAAGPPPVTQVKLPVRPAAAWSTATPAGAYPAAERWWESFGDEKLTALVTDALAENPVLSMAEARIRRAAARARAAGADLLPHLSAGAQAGRSEDVTPEIPLPPPIVLPDTVKQDRYGVSLNLSWEADLWGRIRAGRSAALADVQATEAEYYGAALSLAAQTVKAYFAAVEGREQLEVATANLKSAESLAASIGERFKSGLRTALDVRFAASETADAKTRVALRKRALDAALRQLETLAVRYPAGKLPVAKALPALPGPVPAGIPADVLSRRPDLASLERRVAASMKRTEEARAALYPRIALTTTRGMASTEMQDLFDGNYGVWSLFANVAAPIFAGGRLRAGVAAGLASREETVAAFGDAVLRAFKEVETALAAERYLAEQEIAARRLVTEAKGVLDLSEDRYLSGLEDILSVLEARRRYFSARSALLRVHLLRLQTRVDVHLALGGGFARRGKTLTAKEAR